ncbi:hypothetical protein NE237_025165 [Protea cynaroides]|uniref:Uncharacterized protein n=1 Tax=Protea cynaroides TaxID=273540 RepID=A0A9Q0JZ91_9MAGN|nr:hypothetical protein NE237_025165 [Protea cynaroides]
MLLEDGTLRPIMSTTKPKIITFCSLIRDKNLKFPREVRLHQKLINYWKEQNIAAEAQWGYPITRPTKNTYFFFKFKLQQNELQEAMHDDGEATEDSTLHPSSLRLYASVLACPCSLR